MTVTDASGSNCAATTTTLDVFVDTPPMADAGPDANIFISLKDREERERSGFAIQQTLRPVLAEFPDYRSAFVQDQGGATGSDITVQFVGEDPQAVNAAADRLAVAMGRMDILQDVRASSALRRPEIQIRPRHEDMARLGVTSASLASAIRIATSGDAEQNLPRYDLADRQIPIRVTLPSGAPLPMRW